MGIGSLFRRKKKDKAEEVEECHIDINSEDCDVCEKCIIACPNNVFILKEANTVDLADLKVYNYFYYSIFYKDGELLWYQWKCMSLVLKAQ